MISFPARSAPTVNPGVGAVGRYLPERLRRRSLLIRRGAGYSWRYADQRYGWVKWHGRMVTTHRLTYHLTVYRSIPLRPGRAATD